jgi:predicted RNase H-like nuclease (RuvC/YqgF family)
VSLGDLARQLKAQRAKSQAKPKVFTNDNLPTQSPSGEPSAASPAKSPSRIIQEAKSGEKPAQKTGGNEAEKESTKAPPADTGEQAHGEKYYRERMSKLKDRLEIDQRELSVLEQKLGLNQMQYYPDPNKGLLQESGPTAMSDIYKLQDQIAKKRSEVAADQQAIDDLREQLRREGGDAGWLR